MRIGKANGEDWLRLSEAARALGVSLNTVRRWSDSGQLVGYRSPGGHRRFRRADVDTLIHGAAAEHPDAARSALTAGHWERLRAPLSALAQVTAEAIGVTSCAFVVETGEHEVTLIAEHSREGQARRAGRTEAGPTEDFPVAAEVLRNGRRLVIADLNTTTLLTPAAAERCLRLGYAASLALPLTLEGGVNGVMELSESRAPRTFTGANVTFAEFMARQASRISAGEDAGGSVSDQVVDSLALPHEAAPQERPPTAETEGAGSVLATALRLRDEVASLLEVYGGGGEALGAASADGGSASADGGSAAAAEAGAPGAAPAAPPDRTSTKGTGLEATSKYAPEWRRSPDAALGAMTRPADDERLAGAALAALRDGASLDACTLHRIEDGFARLVASVGEIAPAAADATS
ncbi:MAG TPA: helix-turn-helix domain-containing protein, partial [Thermoleophilia bacterium]|nr:helix-turn-helix domain-containing protein [Thermoleophilia bacterium]